jgi:PhoPQ-activated pathogenicity-related protein
MRLDCWYAGLFRSFPTSRRSNGSRNRERRFSSRRRRWGVVSARARIEVLEDRALLSGTPGGPTPGGNSTLPTLTPAQITALDTYVAAPDSSYTYSLNSTLTGTGYTDYVINMVSQTWTPSPGDSQVWQHWLQIIVPTTVSTHTAVLNISGGTNSSTAPTSPDAQSLATATTLNAITVFLPTVPNEPVTFPAQGETTPLTEDQIVAYTFEQFLDGNGQDWPLLLPMVKSAVRAMDTTQSFVSSQSGGTLSVDNFIVTGASKRGWTTWLTPAVDTRVVAIVPYVFDGLNLADQVESQLDTYVGVTQDTVNGDSTAVQDYTGDGVFNFFGTPQMSSLLSIVDPYDYIGRSTYNIPKYLIDSTGDQFFVPGAQFYFSNLPGENYLRYIPNTDHSLDTDAVTGGIDFEKALLDGAALPQFTWNVSDSGTTITLNSVTTPSSVTMWQATNTTNRDFRLETFGANWTSSTLTDQGGGTYVAQVTPPSTGATDFFIQMQYTVDGMTLTFTTQISTVPLLTPTIMATDATGTFNGNPFTATATATGPAGLPVPGSFTFSYYTGNSTSGPALPGAPTSPGIYTAVASFTSSDPDYTNGQSGPVHFVIFQATPVITFTNTGTPEVYNGSPFPATATIAGIVAGVDNTPGSSLEGVPLTFTYYMGTNFTGTPLPGPPSTAGEFTALASFAGSQDYSLHGAGHSYFIFQATPTIAVSNPSDTFNGSPAIATATIAGVVPGVDNTPGSTLEGVPLTLSYFAGTSISGTPLPGPPTIAGQYTVLASFAGSQDYEALGKGVAFVISQATPTITVSDLGGTYDGNPFPATGTVAGVVAGVDNTPGPTLEGVPLTFIYFLGIAFESPALPGPPTDAGQYSVVASFAGSQDYTANGPETGFVISQATPTVVASDFGGNFDGNPFPATATATGVGGVTVEGNFSFVYFPGNTTTGTPSAAAPSAPGTYTVVASFLSGDPNYVSDTNSLPVVFAINTLPVLNAPSAESLNQNSSFAFTGPNAISVTDAAGSGNNNETVTLNVSDGTVTLNSAGVTAMGDGTGSLSVSGPLSALNTALASLVYAPTSGFNGSDALKLTVLDTTDQAQGSPAQVGLTINPLPPTITAQPTASVNENASSFAFTGGNAISVSDPSGTAEQLTLMVSHGTLTLGTTTSLTVTGNGTASVTLSGTLANLNNDLPSLTYTPTTGYAGPETLALSDKDTSDNLTGTANVAITVLAPLGVDAPATASVNENTALVFSSAGGNPITITDPNAGSSVEQLTLTVTHGTLTLVTTTGISFTSGSNNSASMTVTGTLTNLNAALNGLQFTPTTGYSGPASLAVTFKDLGNNQSASATVAITVVAPPVTVNLLTFLPIVVPGEPVPFIIWASDTIPAARFGPFKINISFGDGNSATFTAGILPILVNHIYRQDGTFTVTVTATDAFGNTSLPATVVIRVISLRIGFNPFNPNQTALIVGETPGNSYSFGAAANGGIAVTINGVSQGVFNVSGPVIVLGQQGKQLANQSYGFSNQGLLVETPTVDSLESNLDSEALQWAGLSAATEILNE